jgi:hypothetical protein
MNCRDFLAEFEERRNALSQPAQLHMDDCPGCKKTSGEQGRVWEMIDGLKRIDAPNDFDFRVKAKIAGAKPADFQSCFLPALRYVLPLALVVLVLGLLTFNTSFFFGGAQQVADAFVPQTSEKEIAPTNSFASNQTAASNVTNEILLANLAGDNVEPSENKEEKQFVAAKLSPKPRTGAPRKNAKDNFVGSRDLAASKPAERFPLNLAPNQTVETLPDGGNSNSVSDEETLKFLGVEFVRESGTLKITTIRENSPAARSGVKVGDIIEAIDGVKLSAEPKNTKKIEVKKLTVARGAEKIEITLKN